MRHSVTPDSVIERLNRALTETNLPATAQQTARRLIDRLSSPVRVTLLGPRGAGKSTLRNVLAGAAIIPGDTRLPTTMLEFGETGRIIATLGDRTVREIEGLDFEALCLLSPAYAEIHAPHAILKKTSLLEVVTDGSPRDLMAAVKWAAKRTDIAIWVTTDFNPQEQALWAEVPDEMKDHGYLVQSQIDRLTPEELAECKARLKRLAAQDFHGFFPTAALQGLDAVERKDATQSEAFKASGCEDLVAALMRHVDQGTQADIDGALMFLSRFEAPGAKPAAPLPMPAATAAETSDGRAEEMPESSDDSRALHVESILSHDPSPSDEAHRATHEIALARIRSSAGAMLDELSKSEAAMPEHLLDHCAETVEELAAALSDENPLVDPIMQASDVIVLLQLEKTESAAEDAVITLLQLKRDIEVALAA